jgi:hypothetical protein
MDDGVAVAWWVQEEEGGGVEITLSLTHGNNPLQPIF